MTFQTIDPPIEGAVAPVAPAQVNPPPQLTPIQDPAPVVEVQAESAEPVVDLDTVPIADVCPTLDDFWGYRLKQNGMSWIIGDSLYKTHIHGAEKKSTPPNVGKSDHVNH